MKFLKTTIAAVSLAATVTLIAPNANAAAESEIREAAMEKFRAFRSDLELTADQKASIRAILVRHKESIRTQWGQGKSARDSMRKATLEHGPESAEAREAASVLGNVARDRSLLIARIATEVRPILSEGQLRKFEKARGEFEAFIDSKIDSFN